MKEPKRYSCGNGEGMFEDDKNGHWIEYSEHKAIVDALIKQLRKHDVVGQSEQLPPFYCPNCGNEWDTNKNNACQCGAQVRR